jgi:hypothetical protein
VGDTVQPVADLVAGDYRCSFASQDHESGLESVISVVGIAKDAPANTQHHGAMALDEGLESRSVAAGNEAFQKPAIGSRRWIERKESPA